MYKILFNLNLFIFFKIKLIIFFFFSLFTYFIIFIRRSCYILEWDFFFFFLIRINLTLFLDKYFLCMASVVLFIRINVVSYSKYYIEGRKTNNRFLFLLILFILSMIFFLVRPNLISIFLGWDGLGLVSYLLVNFYANKDRLNSGILTVLRNRLGDIFLIIRVYFSLVIGGYRFILWDNYLRWGLFLILLASFTKRAQLPFSSWLPFAIAAPTPISSLVHSSTLVTAGVFLLLRLRDLINEDSLYIVYVRGLVTILVSGLRGIFEVDLKKVIALSTLSQLGLIIIVLGGGYKELAFFHLVIHALFKSRIFMGIGCKIHEYEGVQDSRILSTRWKNPLIEFLFGVTNMALMGFPFISGFFSKDIRLEYFLSSFPRFSINFFFVLRVILTRTYRIKFILMRRFNFRNFFRKIHSRVVNKIVIFSLVFLLLFSITFGYIYYVIFIDYFVIIDLRFTVKFFILFSIFYTLLRIYSYLLKKNFFFFYLLQCLLVCLFFLRELTSRVNKILVNYIYIFKYLDSGWIESFKISYSKKKIRFFYFYLELRIVNRFFTFLFRVLVVILIFFFFL